MSSVGQLRPQAASQQDACLGSFAGIVAFSQPNQEPLGLRIPTDSVNSDESWQVISIQKSFVGHEKVPA